MLRQGRICAVLLRPEEELMLLKVPQASETRSVDTYLSSAVNAFQWRASLHTQVLIRSNFRLLI